MIPDYILEKIKEEGEKYGIGPSSSPSDWEYITKYFIDGAKFCYELMASELYPDSSISELRRDRDEALKLADDRYEEVNYWKRKYSK